MTITKELFIEAIESIKKQLKIDRKCSKAFAKILTNDYVSGYNNRIIDDYICFLEKLTNDKNKDIGYFVWELEFGKKYKSGCYTDKNGKNIKLKTIEDLWDKLIV